MTLLLSHKKDYY